MIRYLTTSRHQYTINAYLASWGKELAKEIKPVTYEELFRTPWLTPACYAFTDFDRLTTKETFLAREVWDALNRAGMPLLNHPARTMRRYELLRMLKEEEINLFDVYRITEHRAPKNFPVYLRFYDEHQGSWSDLIKDAQHLEKVTNALVDRGDDRDRLILEEFLDTKDERGFYRKYSAFAVGERVVPRHIFYSKKWVVRTPDFVDEATIAAELDFVNTNPHRDQLEHIFKLSRTQLGRIDYALVDGKVQVWEINSNPQLMSARDGGGPARMPVHEKGSELLKTAFREVLDRPVPKTGPMRNPAFEIRSRNELATVFRRSLYHLLRATGRLDDEYRLQKKVVDALNLEKGR